MNILHDVLGELIVPSCPYCSLNSVGMHFIGIWQIDEKTWGGAAVCQHCKHGIIFEGTFSTGRSWEKFTFKKIYPSPKFSEIPPHVPTNIAGTLRNAKEHLQRLLRQVKSNNEQEKQEAPATAEVVAVICRMALEKAIKAVLPDEDEKTPLYSRIQHIIESRRLQHILSDWLHTIRCLGNAGAHGDDEVSPQDAVNAVNFTEMLLWYLFTAPAKIEEKRKQQ